MPSFFRYIWLIFGLGFVEGRGGHFPSWLQLLILLSQFSH